MYIKPITFLSAIIGLSLCISCNKSENTATESKEKLTAPVNEINSVIRTNDSLEITELLKKMYKWHAKDELIGDFDVYLADPDDTIYAGIDKHAHLKRIKSIKESNFFTEAFVENYDNIAKTIDKELKKGNVQYYVGELPPFGNESDPWTHSQDSADDYWKIFSLSAINYRDNTIDCIWSWKDYAYTFTLKKENGNLKIDRMEGFNYKEFTSGLYQK